MKGDDHPDPCTGDTASENAAEKGTGAAIQKWNRLAVSAFTAREARPDLDEDLWYT